MPVQDDSLVKCSSCRQLRSIADVDRGVCAECRENVEDAEQLFPAAGGADATRIERELRALALKLEGSLPFTPIGFSTLSRKVLAALSVVHPELDVAALAEELETDTAHEEDNAGALAEFIRAELEQPTVGPNAIAAAVH